MTKTFTAADRLRGAYPFLSMCVSVCVSDSLRKGVSVCISVSVSVSYF